MNEIKTSLWYVVKGYTVKELGVSKVHIVDDNCNEYTALVYGTFVNCGYHKPHKLNPMGLREYNRAEWDELQLDAEWPVHLEKF